MKRKVFLVTGAAGGLGSALARGLSAEGAELVLLDRDSAALDALADSLGGFDGPEPVLCPFDLAQAGPQAYLELVDRLAAEFGCLDGIVHAAVEFAGLAPMDQLAPGQWANALQVNLTAPWALTVTCLPLLRKAGQATVVFLLDDPERSRSAFWGAYGVSKAAVSSLADILSEEMAQSGIRIVKANPGPMRTALRAKAYHAENPTEQADPARAAGSLVRMLMDQGGENPGEVAAS